MHRLQYCPDYICNSLSPLHYFFFTLSVFIMSRNLFHCSINKILLHL
uniref:Uncharacterized protein n=1 Tax=Arundo donax TaxID=35708 RepID=A0A0A8ZLF9_ARUDO